MSTAVSMETMANENALLAALARQGRNGIDADTLALLLGCDSDALARAAQGLRRRGYDIRLNGTSPCRLGGTSPLLSTEIAEGLRTQVIGSRLVTLGVVPSTNDVAWQEALAGAPEGAVVLAEMQSAGRGRMGRSWLAPCGAGILASVVLRPTLDPNRSNLLTVMSAVAVAQALRDQMRLQARIRWPNDITIKGRKVAGILVESRSLPTGGAFVLGIGLNVNMRQKDFPADLDQEATSLLMETGVVQDRAEILRWLLRSLERWYRDLRYGDFGRIARRWRELSSTLGQRVLMIENGREYKGRVLDLSMEDGLIVRLDEGITRIFHPSTVTLRQLS